MKGYFCDYRGEPVAVEAQLIAREGGPNGLRDVPLYETPQEAIRSVQETLELRAEYHEETLQALRTSIARAKAE